MSNMRARIDRTYLLGDTLRKTGSALAVFTALIALMTPFTLQTAPAEIAAPYTALMVGAVVAALAFAVFGARMRRSAARMDRG